MVKHVILWKLDENKTEAEKAEWQGAEKRYALRKKRRIEGF